MQFEQFECALARSAPPPQPQPQVDRAGSDGSEELPPASDSSRSPSPRELGTPLDLQQHPFSHALHIAAQTMSFVARN